MNESVRARILEYVKPLAVGLDGITYFGDIERVGAIARGLAGERAGVDSDLLDLLAIFSGQDRWVEKMGHSSRTEIFLSSLGISGGVIRALFKGLSRLAARPATAEEKIVSDALRIDAMGAYGIARLLQQGYRERLEFSEMAAMIESAARKPLQTPEGEALAAGRRKTMLDFASALNQERKEFDSKI